MTHAMRLRKLLADASSLLIHFAHGGLLVTGFLVAAFIASRIGMGGLSATQTELKNWFTVLAPASRPVAAAGPSVVGLSLASAPGEADPAPVISMPLSPEMRRVVTYLSHKYRIAAPALEPMVASAHVVGSRLGLDPLLILAVMAIESRFNPFAQSDQGAQGLMQIMPQYHQDKLAESEQDHPLLDPVTNIEVGAKVLKESILRAGGLQAGLQQYAGALDDEGGQYAKSVMAEKQRLEAAKKSRHS